MKIIDGIPVWGDPIDEGALAQIKLSAQGAAKAALMADHHKGYAVPIGGVLAYDYAISPSGVGFDIACGNKAVKTDFNMVAHHALDPDVRARWIQRWMDEIWKTISFGMGRKNAEPVDHALFDDPAWKIPAIARLRDKAAAQLGTVGSGNHYVDLFEDENGDVWIGVHFGSRGLGHGIATHYLEAGGAKDGMDVEPLVLSTESDLGREYLEGMRLAGRYAYAGRDWVCQRVADLMGAKIVEEVHNHHNFAWKEQHEGRPMWVVRKGATPAWPGQKGFVGGSMGDNAVIIEGLDNTGGGTPMAQYESMLAMYSTVHGAGRAMSRTAAAGKMKRGKRVTEGRITTEFGIKDPWALSTWLRDTRGVVLRGAGLDEAPQAYKRLPEVLAHHSQTIRILHTLRPLGVAMAGPDVRDPYKD